MDIADDFASYAENLQKETSKNYCTGYQLFQKEEEFYRKYPFGLHGEVKETAFKDLVPIEGFLFSRKCFERNFALSNDSISRVCGDCSRLETLNAVQNIQKRANQTYEENPNLNFKYLSMEQLKQKIEHQEKQINESRLEKLNTSRKINVFQKKISTHH